jgi:hypothetical protein
VIDMWLPTPSTPVADSFTLPAAQSRRRRP